MLNQRKSMRLSTPLFETGGKIPSLYTCEGKNINPPLKIADVPAKAKTLVLIMDDPDVPEFVRKDRMYVHWVVYNMPPSTAELKENTPPPGVVGMATNGKNQYVGPCPPDREHRYFFKLYALDISLNLSEGATKEQVLKAMEGHIVAQAELMGKYEKIHKS